MDLGLDSLQARRFLSCPLGFMALAHSSGFPCERYCSCFNLPVRRKLLSCFLFPDRWREASLLLSLKPTVLLRTWKKLSCDDSASPFPSSSSKTSPPSFPRSLSSASVSKSASCRWSFSTTAESLTLPVISPSLWMASSLSRDSITEPSTC